MLTFDFTDEEKQAVSRLRAERREEPFDQDTFDEGFLNRDAGIQYGREWALTAPYGLVSAVASPIAFELDDIGSEEDVQDAIERANAVMDQFDVDESRGRHNITNFSPAFRRGFQEAVFQFLKASTLGASPGAAPIAAVAVCDREGYTQALTRFMSLEEAATTACEFKTLSDAEVHILSPAHIGTAGAMTKTKRRPPRRRPLPSR